MQNSNVESYKHKFAKETLANWLREVANEGPDEYVELAPFQWRVNRSGPTFGVWMEYPICLDKQNEIVGYSPCWDESGWEDPTAADLQWIDYSADCVTQQRPPSYGECIALGYVPIVIFDIVVQHKGHPVYAIEVVHRNGISATKMAYIDRIATLGVRVFTVDADWVLCQIGRPKKIKCKQVA